MANLSVKINHLSLKNPVMTASGTFGYGLEYADFVPLEELGGIIVKGTTLEPRQGNDYPRMAETPQGMLNCVGLQNKGVDYFCEHIYPRIKDIDTHFIVNVSGNSPQTYAECAARLAGLDRIPAIELNISCPNVKHGGIAYGVKPESAKEVVSRVRRVCSRPLIVKVSPQAEDIGRMAAACVEAGADALSLVNTFQACAIDLEKRRPVFNNIFAGLSGPAVRPIALRMVWQAVGAVDGAVPVIGLGGIASGEDALQFIMAGAAAVQVGTANFADPHACQRITREIDQWMDAHGVNSLDEIRGCARG